jgi:non-homologous end joining protein Ku
MRKTGMVALGRLVMRHARAICALEVEEDALLLTTLRSADEVRAAGDVGPIELPKPDPRMLEIAQKIMKVAVSKCLASRFPMVVWWGSELLMLYNDAWQPILGETKHPGGLG